MSLQKKPIEFTWDEDFERELFRRLLVFRGADKGTGNLIQKLAYERQLTGDFVRALHTLIAAHAPTVAIDSDIAAAVARIPLPPLSTDAETAPPRP